MNQLHDTPWVVFRTDIPQALLCARCGTERPMKPKDGPTPIDACIAWWEVFALAHHNCEEKIENG